MVKDDTQISSLEQGVEGDIERVDGKTEVSFATVGSDGPIVSLRDILQEKGFISTFKIQEKGCPWKDEVQGHLCIEGRLLKPQQEMREILKN